MVVGIYGENSQVEFKLIEIWGFPERTCHSGGYDGKWEVDIKSGNYTVNEIAVLSTGEIYKFGSELQKMYKDFDGKVEMKLFETDFEISLLMNKRGQISVEGYFQAQPSVNNKLEFEFNSDQSYLTKTFEQIKRIEEAYGGMKGLRSVE